MSKEFQRIKERNDVKKQLNEFLTHSFSQTVSKYSHSIRISTYIDRLHIFIDYKTFVQHVFVRNSLKLMKYVENNIYLLFPLR